MTERSSQLDAVGCDIGASSPWERRVGPNMSRGGFKSAFLWGSTPFLCARAKKWGGTGSRGRRLLTNKTAHTYQPPAKVGRGTPRPQSSSAHADGGAAKVKKRFSLAARHRFFGQAPKKWGRMAAGANDHLPTYRRTRTNPRINKRGKPLDRVSPLNPLPDLYEQKESSALCGARPGTLSLDPAAFEKAGETFKRASRSEGRSLAFLDAADDGGAALFGIHHGHGVHGVGLG